ncbi:phage head closure protein [Brucella pseudogrignonensis]|uniref:phage head closure protein n=1 Tax=Brucella TaxID=234 RepID=UPI0028BA0B10|nr:phage head closure protein [Brucella pseudogrignonensis]MDT6940383.1 phage head closure protein [Brucella pseudogrignonensis]
MNKILLIDPSQFKTELALETMQPVADGMGGYKETWSEVAIVWGKLEPISSTPRGQVRPFPELTHRIYVRYRGDITSDKRFRKGERIFTLRTVYDPDESKRYLTCLAVEVGR